MNLKGKNALVTGSSEGLGFEISKGFLKNGANLFMCSRSKEKLANAISELKKIKSSDQKIHYLVADVSKESNCEEIFSEFFCTFSKIDILVNNAGIIGPKGKFENLDWLKWKYAVEVNLFGSSFLIYKFITEFKKQNFGTIIQISGGGATSPLPNLSAYACSKAAIVRFIETISLELKEFNVSANSIAPGPLNTQILDEFIQAGPDGVGIDFYKKALKQKQNGGAPVKKTVDLCIALAKNKVPLISGKLISSIWDDWDNFEKFANELNSSDVYTLRRITARDRNFAWGDL